MTIHVDSEKVRFSLPSVIAVLGLKGAAYTADNRNAEHHLRDAAVLGCSPVQVDQHLVYSSAQSDWQIFMGHHWNRVGTAHVYEHLGGPDYVHAFIVDV